MVLHRPHAPLPRHQFARLALPQRHLPPDLPPILPQPALCRNTTLTILLPIDAALALAPRRLRRQVRRRAERFGHLQAALRRRAAGRPGLQVRRQDGPVAQRAPAGAVRAEPRGRGRAEQDDDGAVAAVL